MLKASPLLCIAEDFQHMRLGTGLQSCLTTAVLIGLEWAWAHNIANCYALEVSEAVAFVTKCAQGLSQQVCTLKCLHRCSWT